MRNKLFLLGALIGALLIASGITSLVRMENINSNTSYERYNDALTTATDLYPQFFGGEPLSMEEMANITRAQRNRNIEAWWEVIESSEDEILLANALFYFSLNHYANAKDFGDVESAKLAVLGLDGSMKSDPGDASDGYSKIQWKRKQLYESALNLQQKAEEKQEEENRQKQGGRAEVPTLPTQGSESGSGEDPPELKPGVRP